MTDQSSQSIYSGFARHLSAEHSIEESLALEALNNAKKNNSSYINYLLKQKLISEINIAQAVSEYYGLPLFDINAFNFDLIPEQFLNIELVRKRIALPLLIKKKFLYLAVVDPTNEDLNESRFLTGLDIRLIIAEKSVLIKAIDVVLNSLILSEMDSGTQSKQDKENNLRNVETDISSVGVYDVDSAPVVNYVNKILLDAIEKNASDIHFEQYENDFRIRYRLHGALYSVTEPPQKISKFILARIKILSNLDITEHRIPQDGRFKLTLSRHRTVDFRVSICPTLFGEKVVLRILDMEQNKLSLDDLGMEPIEKERLLNALNRSQGMILVTGPTGSGKTITLYSSLNYLNSTEDNISAVEDPVEITLHGINQVQVNAKVGLTFASALRSFLRQDPDIIMVGEIRDLETAEIAIKAAQTGHLVLSTVHTNSAPETVSRLMNMGVEHYNLASSLILVGAQRLLRTLCPKCKKIEVIANDILVEEGFKPEEIGTFQLYQAGTCASCIHGYTGRIGIFEMMPISATMSQLIMQGANAIEIAAQAKKENITDLRQAGLKKVKEGITSLAELNRIFK